MEEELSTKKPWMMFAGICSVVIGIVLLCVIMGGYTSLLRAKSRVNAAKLQWTKECAQRSEMVKALSDMARTSMDPESVDKVLENERQASVVLDRMNEIETPLDPELILDFKASQTRITQDISQLVLELEQNNSVRDSKSYQDLVTSIREHQEILFYAGRRYNKDARYFNQRKTVFPGFFVAKWFGLAQITFPEIPADIFNALETGSAKESS
ncbi:LemA family protein [Desulfospira joergensenii]|uniref:LemA family protein n=1 Tax=Desulfospira joergensenii TaxID=53329 RepID=UPI0003B38076|nr:LemA family protein [Desulfospira joergensenii]